MSCFIQHALQTEKRDLRQPSHVAYGKTLLVHLVHLLPWKALSSLLCHVQVSNRILHFRITSYSQQCVGRLHSFPFSPPLRFGLLAISEASSNIKIEASRLTSLEFWLVCNIWLTYWTGRERRLFCFRLACLPFGRVMILASVFWSVAPSGGKIENSAKVLPPLCQSCFYYRLFFWQFYGSGYSWSLPVRWVLKLKSLSFLTRALEFIQKPWSFEDLEGFFFVLKKWLFLVENRVKMYEIWHFLAHFTRIEALFPHLQQKCWK